ncbi:MAG: universal stress protein [Polyangiaceae bacterium]
MAARILIATDLSEASNEGLRQAARYTDAALALVHVMPNLLDMQPLFPQGTGANPTHATELEAKVLAALEESARNITSKALEIFLEQGDPSERVADRAKAWNAELVVVGSHGRTGLARVLLGSVAESLAKESPCSVLVARPHAAGPVLVATDLSEASRPLLSVGAREAQRRGTKLHVVHVVDHVLADFASSALAQFVGVLPPYVGDELLRETREAAKNDIDATLQGLSLQADVEIIDGSAASAIARHASKLGAELLVVGAHGKTGARDLVLGTVTSRVLRSAESSVLVVRA